MSKSPTFGQLDRLATYKEEVDPRDHRRRRGRQWERRPGIARVEKHPLTGTLEDLMRDGIADDQ